jgi:hypothetical protein
MEQISGVSFPVFLGLTVVLMGGAAYMTGQALGATWRPLWMMFLYCLLLGCADRFLTFALFQGALFSLAGYALDTAVITAIGFTAFRLTRARKMGTQYPWLYQRSGPFSWSARVD